MLATVTGAARGLSGHGLRRLLGLWVYALSFRREALSILDVAFVDVERFPLQRRCAVDGALLDELLASTILAPLLDTDLCERRQSFRRRSLLDACVSRALDPSLRFLRRQRVLSEVRLGHEVAAHAGTARLAGGGCQVSG